MSQELQDKLQALEKRVAELEKKMPEDKVAIVIFSGDLDRALAAFVLATGAVAMGQQVTMFFTFWGYNVLRKKKIYGKKNILAKAMSLLSPKGSLALPLSHMNYCGIGAKILRKMMKDKNINSLEEFIILAKEMGVHMIACEMTRDLLGIEYDELIPGLESGGVAAFLGEALTGRMALFI